MRRKREIIRKKIRKNEGAIALERRDEKKDILKSKEYSKGGEKIFQILDDLFLGKTSIITSSSPV